MRSAEMVRHDVRKTNGMSPRGLGRRALTLAMTESREDEEEYKTCLMLEGLQCVATEVGGSSDGDYQSKITKAIIGAALNSGVIEKEPRSIHALMHAADEAKRGVIVNLASPVNLATKVAIVRNVGWVAVALYGESSLHVFSGHERVGLGVMHLP